MASKSKLQWGDLSDDDDLNSLLPPRQVIGPDENGIKKTIEYNIDDNGNTVKITTTTRVKKITMSKRAAERRAWKKFGDAVGDNSGITMVSTEEILLERPTVPGTVAKESYGNSMTEAGKSGGAALMQCRTCGKQGDHWTVRCPYKDLAPSVEKTSEAELGGGGKSGSSAYVPPVRRAGAGDKQPLRRRNDENSVRVTNLSEGTTEDDLRELFGVFGALERVCVVIDKMGRVSKGFGYVNFVRKEDAERAISKLNGYGYDHLILRVEWAAPRTV